MTDQSDLREDDTKDKPNSDLIRDLVASMSDESEEFIGLEDEQILDIGQALDLEDRDAVNRILADYTAADTAELLGKLSKERRNTLLKNHGSTFDPETFLDLNDELRASVLEDLSAPDIARIIADLDTDDALDMILPLDEDFRKDIIKNLSAKTRVALEEGFNFPEESAGRLMQREFVAIPQFWTVGKTIDYLRAAASELPEEFFDLFVITPSYHIKGTVPLNRLVKATRIEKIEDLADEHTHTISATLDQEEVALLFRREGLTSAPVVDEDDRLIGVITVDDVVDVIDEEAQEDFLKVAGVDQSDFYRTLIPTAGLRFRWLFVNLWTAFLASFVISFFEATITEIVALAVLMPIVASMGGNAGTQALTVAVRALATRELSSANMWRTIRKEMLVGTINGIGFALITGLIAALWFSSPALGFVIGLAMVINLIIAGLAGSAIPVLLDRYGADPAVSSVIFLTTFTDVVGFLAFLGLSALFLL